MWGWQGTSTLTINLCGAIPELSFSLTDQRMGQILFSQTGPHSQTIFQWEDLLFANISVGLPRVPSISLAYQTIGQIIFSQDGPHSQTLFFYRKQKGSVSYKMHQTLILNIQIIQNNPTNKSTVSAQHIKLPNTKDDT